MLGNCLQHCLPTATAYQTCQAKHSTTPANLGCVNSHKFKHNMTLEKSTASFHGVARTNRNFSTATKVPNKNLKAEGLLIHNEKVFWHSPHRWAPNALGKTSNGIQFRFNFQFQQETATVPEVSVSASSLSPSGFTFCTPTVSEFCIAVLGGMWEHIRKVQQLHTGSIE